MYFDYDASQEANAVQDKLWQMGQQLEEQGKTDCTGSWYSIYREYLHGRMDKEIEEEVKEVLQQTEQAHWVAMKNRIRSRFRKENCHVEEVEPNTSTIQMLDRYHKSPVSEFLILNFHGYDLVLILHSRFIKTQDEWTITDLKCDFWRKHNLIKELNACQRGQKGPVYFFSRPFRIRAQNSWQRNYEKFGETNRYLMVGLADHYSIL